MRKSQSPMLSSLGEKKNRFTTTTAYAPPLPLALQVSPKTLATKAVASGMGGTLEDNR